MRDKYMARGEPMPVVHRLRRRSDDLPDGLQRSALRRLRVRRRRRHPRQAGRGGQGPDHRPADSRPMPRSSSRASSSPATCALEGPFGEWTGYYASDHARPSRCSTSRRSIIATIRSCSAACRSGRRTRSARYRAVDALGAAAREHRQGRRARRHRRLGARGRHRAAPARASRSSSAIPATPSRPATSPPCAMSAPMRALRHRGRRRHRRLEPRRADLGDADALRSRRPRSTSSATPGRRRSIRASSPSARRRATSPTAAPSSTPAGRGTGATSSRRSTCRRPKKTQRIAEVRPPAAELKRGTQSPAAEISLDELGR